MSTAARPGTPGRSTPAVERASARAARPRTRGLLWYLRIVLFLAALAPLAVLLWDLAMDNLGADPVKAIEHRTGWWGLFILLATLSITPLRRLSGWNQLIQLRRMLGLWAFAYACIHFLVYLVIDQGLAFGYIGEDIAKRPYVTVGFAAWVLMIPLAWTSTKGWIRKLGKRWQKLHRLVYFCAAFGVLHYYWLVKKDVRPPLKFAAVLLVLLLLRLPFVISRLSARSRGRPRLTGVTEEG